MMKSIFFLFVLISFLDGRIYRDDNKKVVLDDERLLMWQDDNSVLSNSRNHKNAKKYCQELNFAGYSNWRLPTKKEYKSIVNRKNIKSNINFAFKNNLKNHYWASKAHWRTFWFYADYMFFVSGTVYYDNRKKKKFVRCIRDIK